MRYMYSCDKHFCRELIEKMAGLLQRFPSDPEVRGAWIKFSERGLPWLPGPGARLDKLINKNVFISPYHKT